MITNGVFPELMDTPENLYHWVGGAYGGKESSFQPVVQTRCNAVGHREFC